MSRVYSVKEMFYTLQGEGAHAGLPAVFVRFAGCNLWSGLERDRATARGSCAAWCDTDFVGTNGVGGGKYTAAGLVAAVLGLWPSRTERPRIVLTGGEPLLRVDENLVGALLAARCWISVETNGTQPVPVGIDWVCMSPKAGQAVVLASVDELKIVWPQELDPEAVASTVSARHFSIQPRSGLVGSVNAAVAYAKNNPRWRVSLQLHKILGIP